MTKRMVVGGMVFVGLMMFIVGGCGSKINKDNFDKIKVDMTKAEVQDILGKPTDEKSGGGMIGNVAGAGTIATWKDGEKTITVTFVNDKVVTTVQSGL